MSERCGDVFHLSNSDHVHCELAGGHAGKHYFGTMWGRELPHAIPSHSAHHGVADIEGCRCELPRCALPAGSIIVSPLRRECSIGAMRPGPFVWEGRLGFKSSIGIAYYSDGELFTGGDIALVTPCRVVCKIMD